MNEDKVREAKKLIEEFPKISLNKMINLVVLKKDWEEQIDWLNEIIHYMDKMIQLDGDNKALFVILEYVKERKKELEEGVSIFKNVEDKLG